MEALTKSIVEGKLKRILTKLHVASLADDPKVNYRAIALLSREFKTEFGLAIVIHEKEITELARRGGVEQRKGKTVRRSSKRSDAKEGSADSPKVRKAAGGAKVSPAKPNARKSAGSTDASANRRGSTRNRVTTRAK